MNISTVVSEALVIQRTISEQLEKDNLMSENFEEILKAFVASTLSKEAILYATVDENYLECMGEYNAHDYKTNIRYDEDCIGKSAAVKRSICSVDENKKTAQISVPILRMHNTIGTIVLSKDGAENYSDNLVEIIETLSLSLADLLSSKKFLEYRNQIIREKGIVVKDSLKG